MATVAAILTVRSEPTDRLARRFAELAAQDLTLDEVVVAAPAEEHPSIKAVAPPDAPFALRLVDNPGGQRSAGLNLAIRAATADLLVRVDARSGLSPAHVAICAAVLDERPEVGVVSGPQIPVAGREDAVSRGIARALANPWALGGATYRRVSGAGPVDTVYLGAFRRHELLEVGGYDDRLVANEDFELCQRYRRKGLTVWLHPEAAVAYEPRTSFGSVAAQYFAFGRSKVSFWRLTGAPAQARQRVALAGATGGVVLAGWVLRRPRRAPGALVVVASALALVDDLGSHRAPVSVGVRAAALCTYPVVWAAWSAGVLDATMRS